MKLGVLYIVIGVVGIIGIPVFAFVNGGLPGAVGIGKAVIGWFVFCWWLRTGIARIKSHKSTVLQPQSDNN